MAELAYRKRRIRRAEASTGRGAGPGSIVCVITLLFGGLSSITAQEELLLDGRLRILESRAPGRVALLGDGQHAAVSQGRFHVSADGKTWEALAAVPAGPGPEIDGGLLVSNGQGGLVLVYRDDAGMELKRTPDNLPLPGARLQVWVVRSEDGGFSWTDHQILISGFCGAMIDGICLASGRLVIPLQELRYSPPRHVTVVFSSENGGATWHRSEDLDIGGHGIEDGCFEPTVAERDDGSLLLLLRTTRDQLWRAESDDGGQSWSAPRPTTLAASNSPAFLLKLSSGRLALLRNPVGPTDGRAWPRRIEPRYAEQPDSVYREELQLALSDDDGETWTPPAVVATQPGARLRYAYMIETQPGHIQMALRGQWYEWRERDFVIP